MKPKVFLPPLFSLIAVGIWLASQYSTLSTLRAKIENLRNQISSASSASSANVSPELSQSHDRETDANAPIDWQKTARLVRLAGNSSLIGTREITRLRMRIGAMTAKQISAAIDEIEGLDL